MKKFLSVISILLFCVLMFCACQPPQEECAHSWVLQPSENGLAVGAVRNYSCQFCNLTKSEKIKNVVLIIGDGMGLEHIAAGQAAFGKTFGFTSFKTTSVNTDCINPDTGFATKTTDSAAAATALATGTLTYKKYVGKDIDGTDLTTIMDVAHSFKMKTGVVTTDKLYGATPSGFTAHTTNRNNKEEILQSQSQGNVNLLCATSSATVLANREKFEEGGYAFCDSFDNRSSVLRQEKAVCLFDLEGYGESVQLRDAALFGLSFLDNDNGFVLMIEQAHVDKFSHNNDFSNMVAAVNSLNDTVEAVLDWVGDRNDTAVLITADHETGDLSVSKSLPLDNSYECADGQLLYYSWSQTSHSDSDVALFCYGFDVDFSLLPYFGNQRIVKNTDVFQIMKGILTQICSSPHLEG